MAPPSVRMTMSDSALARALEHATRAAMASSVSSSTKWDLK